MEGPAWGVADGPVDGPGAGVIGDANAGGGDETLARRHLRNIVGHGDGLSPGRGNLLHDGIGYGRTRVLASHGDAEVGHDHLGAFGRGGQGHGPADPATAAGDRDRLAFEEPSHVRSPGQFRPGSPGAAVSLVQ